MSRGGGGWARIAAPAKVNTHLEVLGRRADGYHEIETYLLALELHDVVAARRADEPGVRLEVTGPCASADVPRDERNLVVRAARAALALLPPEAREGTGVELVLEKNVPSGAGLGGGSSDAAAALAAVRRALADAFDAPGAERLDERRREAVLAALGSDCVFFEKASATGFALCNGRGEAVRPRPLADRGWSLVVVAPDVRCDTASVYRALPAPLSGDPRAPSFCIERLAGTQDEIRRGLFNRLEGTSLRIHPELGAWRRLFDESGLEHFRMSGSGSAFFGIYRDGGEAAEVARSLADAARARGLTSRGTWVTRPSGAGRWDLDRRRP